MDYNNQAKEEDPQPADEGAPSLVQLNIDKILSMNKPAKIFKLREGGSDPN